MRKFFFLFMLSFWAWQSPLAASPSVEAQLGELTKVVYELRQMVAVQQQEINFLKEARKTDSSPTSAASATTPVMPGGLSATRGKWNPDIGVIADVVFKHDSPKADDGADRLSVRELELVMGSYVDPYSRMDVNIAFSDLDEVHIQEAYLTRFGLPLETTARVGRSKPKVGKALLYHRDVLDTADYPLVIQRYFGDDGLNKTGVDFTKPLNLPFESAHEFAFGIIEGGNGEDGGSAFGDARRRPTVYSHLKNFWDVTDVTSLELGASHMLGSQDADAGMETNVAALDGTMIHLYGPDQRIKLQSELFYLNQSESLDKNRLGTYGLLDVKFHKQWSVGARADYAQIVNNGVLNGGAETGYTGYLTFFQTEFARWRLQYNHINSDSGKDDNQFLIQGIFAIGEHKHKIT